MARAGFWSHRAIRPALAAAILRLADDPALRARLGAGGRRLVEREFSEDRIADATLELWRRLLD